MATPTSLPNLEFELPNFDIGEFSEIFGGEMEEDIIDELMRDDFFDDVPPLPIHDTADLPAPNLMRVQDDVKPSIMPQQFAIVNDEGLRGLIDNSVSKATAKNTTWGVKIFRQWLQVREFAQEFETLSREALNDRLRLFYAEVRNSQGELYSKSTFVGLREAIHRHIRAPPFERDVNILKDREFHTSNNILLSMIRKLKKEGLDETRHHSSISQTELSQIRDSFDTSSPLGLVRKVWYDVTLGFARRGTENQHDLCANSFRVSVDEDGFEYIEMTHSEVTKNHRGDLKDDVEPNKRVYATNSVHCPVRSFKLYLAAMNKGNNAFYQQPKRSVNLSDTVWYTTRPIGTNTLACFMKDICKTAGLQKSYTNHCLRATAVTLLSHAGVENREICKITGHRNDESLKSYSVESSSFQKRAYSEILQGERNDVTPVVRTPLANINNLQINRSFDNAAHGLFHMSNSNITINNYFK